MKNDQRLYYAYSDYLKSKYGEKVYKLPVNLPVSCPNRTDGNRGCSFCAGCGTGFEAMDASVSVKEDSILNPGIMHISLLHIFKIIRTPFCLSRILDIM